MQQPGSSRSHDGQPGAAALLHSMLVKRLPLLLLLRHCLAALPALPADGCWRFPRLCLQGEADSALDHLWTKKRSEIGQ